MKIAPTIEGGLRIDAESAEDWHILRAIGADANGAGTDLATRLGGLVTDERIASDWQEIVVPDLRESFADDLHFIYATIETAAAFQEGGESPIWITPEDALLWYGGLNQARLALEERYGFGSDPDSNVPDPSIVRREALLRSQFYCALQSFILEHAL